MNADVRIMYPNGCINIIYKYSYISIGILLRIHHVNIWIM